MSNFRIGMRLLIGFGLIVLLTVILGLFSLEKHSALQSLTMLLDSRDFGTLATLYKVHRAADQMRAAREGAMLAAVLRKDHHTAASPENSEQEWVKHRNESAALLDDMETTLAAYEAQAITVQRALTWRRIRSLIREAGDALRALSPEVEKQFAQINRGDIDGALTQTAVIENAATVYDRKLDAAQQGAEDQRQIGRGDVTALASETRRSVIAVLVASVLAGILLALAIQRSITRPLREFASLIERVGQGDLTGQIESARQDELGDLARSLDRMVRGLKDVAAQTRQVAESLSAATAQILASTQQQAAGTAEQAAAVQQANATMAEITRSGAQISDRAKQVAASAETTTSASAAGLQSVQNTATIMESIREQAEAVAENVIALSEKTQAVGEIISTVNDIAEQSHLLALNAAIQAAAAGEQGRAFSVVATEIKVLAAQSKQATVQVRSILGDIQKAITSSVMLTEEAVKRVESGRQQADVADRTIRQLSGKIDESVRAFQQIVGGSGQQQIGFEQVTEAFRNIGIASQETAASTKQSEQAAANLSTLAQQLIKAVERYRI